ncbi:MAG: hypothetical protein ACKV22_10765 [Bryobacteraceae bacterium]
MLRNIPVLFFVFCLAAANAQPGPSKVLVATGQPVQLQLTNPGWWECEGGQKTTTGPPFCTPGTKNMWFWGLSSKYEFKKLSGSAADLLTGELITSVIGNFDSSFFGFMFGTFEWKVPGAGGTWLGSFTVTADQARGLHINKAVAYGSGGALEGLKMEYYEVNPGAGQPPVFIAVVAPK